MVVELKTSNNIKQYTFLLIVSKVFVDIDKINNLK
jgi:hypothetical protein